MPEITAEYSLIRAGEARVLPYGWGSLCFLADAFGGTSPHVSMAKVVIAAGKRNMLHVHPNCDELLYLLTGRVRHRVGEKWIDMAPSDTIRIARGIIHQAEVTSTQDAEMIVVYSAGDRQTVVLEEESK